MIFKHLILTLPTEVPDPKYAIGQRVKVRGSQHPIIGLQYVPPNDDWEMGWWYIILETNLEYGYSDISSVHESDVELASPPQTLKTADCIPLPAGWPAPRFSIGQRVQERGGEHQIIGLQYASAHSGWEIGWWYTLLLSQRDYSDIFLVHETDIEPLHACRCESIPLPEQWPVPQFKFNQAVKTKDGSFGRVIGMAYQPHKGWLYEVIWDEGSPCYKPYGCSEHLWQDEIEPVEAMLNELAL